jgi:hypothetical protein
VIEAWVIPTYTGNPVYIVFAMVFADGRDLARDSCICMTLIVNRAAWSKLNCKSNV